MRGFGGALAAVLAVPAFAIHSDAQDAAAGKPPSFCRPGETSILDARLRRMVIGPAGLKYLPPVKYVSLCADRASEPYAALTYRFGTSGKVELEAVATPADRFGVFEIDENKAGAVGVSFMRGGFTFYVSQATGMGSGVGVTVYQNHKKVADYFSGNDDSDFSGDLESTISTDPVRSPVFVKRAPADPI